PQLSHPTSSSTLPLLDALPICSPRQQLRRPLAKAAVDLDISLPGKQALASLFLGRCRDQRGDGGLQLACRDEIIGAQVARLRPRSEEHTSELQSREKLVCRLLL